MHSRTPEDSDDEEEPIENRTDSESDMETETNPNTTTGACFTFSPFLVLRFLQKFTKLWD